MAVQLNDAWRGLSGEGERTVATASAALARLGLELQAAGGPLHAPLRALRRLAAARDGALAPHAPALALLAARARGGVGLGSTLALLAREAARPGGGFAGARVGASLEQALG